MQKTKEKQVLDDNILFQKEEPASVVYSLDLNLKAKHDYKQNDIKDITDIEIKEGFVALGCKSTGSGSTNYVWSNYKQTVFEIKDTNLNKNFLCSALGYNYVKENFSFINEAGKRIYDIDQLSKLINDSCIKAGIYNTDNKKGGGIYKDPASKDDLIINSGQIWGTRKDFEGNRVINKTVYEQVLDLEILPTTPEATQAEINQIFDVFKTFDFVKSRNANYSLGWVATAFLCGVTNERSQATVTAPPGSGKSAYLNFIKNMLGKFAEVGDGNSSEPGIRQSLGNNHIAMLMDESEAEGPKLASILTFLRGAYSGSVKRLGSSDQKGIKYSIKTQGLLVGVVPPSLTRTDLSRFLRMELQVKGTKTLLPKLLRDEEAQRRIGYGIAMVMINNYKLFKTICNLTRYHILNMATQSRYADTYTPPVAASYMLLNIDKLKKIDLKNQLDIDLIDADVEKYLIDMGIQEDLNTTELAREEESFLNEILNTELRDDVTGTSTIIELLKDLNDKTVSRDLKNRIDTVLARVGLRLYNSDRLYIDTTNESLKRLIKNDRYKKADLLLILKRLDKAEILKDRTVIGNMRVGRSCVVSVPIDTNPIEKGDAEGIRRQWVADSIPSFDAEYIESKVVGVGV